MVNKAFMVVVLAALAASAIAIAQQREAVDQATFGTVEVTRTESHVMRPDGVLVIPWHVNYQGYLTDNAGNPINDTLGMTFRIYTALAGGTELWNEGQSVVIEDGIFNTVLGTVTPISSDIFGAGASRWLELTVEAQVLSPRTEITSVGYAYRSVKTDSADYADMVDGFDASVAPTANDLFPLSYGDAQYVNEGQADAITSSMIADGTLLRADVAPAFKAPYADTADYAINAPADNDWVVSGSNMYSAVPGSVGIGTATPAEMLDVNGTAKMSGFSLPAGATSGYVLTSDASGQGTWQATTAGADSDWTIAGNVLHPVGAYGLAMRSSNILHGTQGNTHVNLGVACTTGNSGENWQYCTVSGGYQNVAGGRSAIVGGGEANMADSAFATVGGGERNWAIARYATLGGGRENVATGENSFVGGGVQNTAGGRSAIVGGGETNTASGDFATLGGGVDNQAAGPYAIVSGGVINTASGAGATVGGGYGNTASAWYATVGGGWTNSANDTCATISGGYRSYASQRYATVGGGCADTASGVYATVGGGGINTASDSGATVSGGYQNYANQGYATVGGGCADSATGIYATVGGGRSCAARSAYSTIGGGGNNSAGGSFSTIGGGIGNIVAGTYATVGGGANNYAPLSYATVGGGALNAAVGVYSTVAGGYHDTCDAAYGFAVGLNSVTLAAHINSAAFNGQTTTASGQTRVGALSKASGSFTIDHPLEPMRKILNHYFVESPEMVLIYRGVARIGADGRAPVHLPDYFHALNRNPMVQLTGVGTYEVFIAEKVEGNRFVIGGKPGTEVYWTVTGDRRDQSAEITRIIMPVEQAKDEDLAGRSLDDDFLATTKAQLDRMGEGDHFSFRTARGRQKFEQSQRALLEKR